ncbi:MAG: response regulator [Verrucomicrobia subdivision 3 bacterium]|nr:response regulator [Limisphaerales bacterium]
MVAQPKILLLDDDQDFLDLYKEMLTQHLSCLPEVRTASSGSRALSLLESEPFTLMVVDLNMPKMDGLQVLSIARRKYPTLKLVVLTGIRDEQFRTRAYAMGIDQYWIKPESDQEMGLFMESIESLLNREAQGGFRGVQSKSLVDIIQLECLSQSSSVLKITNGVVEGKIWIQNGEVIDAEAAGITAEPAFQRILSWKTGSFEIMPADSLRPRAIFTSYQGLLLNTAQAIDEAASQPEPVETPGATPVNEQLTTQSLLVEVSQMTGIDFALILGKEKKAEDFWGLDNPKPVTTWLRQTIDSFKELGERLQVGEMQQITATGLHKKISIATAGKSSLCIGFPSATSTDQMRETMRTIVTKWVS